MERLEGKNHFFESEPSSGILVYVLDNNEPVQLNFNTLVKVQVLFDSCDSWSTTLLGKDYKSDHTEGVSICGSVTESTLGDSVSPGAAYKLTSTDHDDGEVHVENGLENVGQSADSEKWVPKERRAKRFKPFGELKNSESPKRVNRSKAAGAPCYKPVVKKEEENKGKSEISDEAAPECDLLCSMPEDDSKPDQCDKKLRRSNRAVKLSIKLPKATKASKAAKTLLKSKIKNKAVSKICLVKHRNPDLKSESNLKVKERPRKLLIDKTVKCEYCAVDFKNQQEFYDHRRAEESIHKCGICGKIEPYEAHLIVHMQKHRRAKVEAALDSPAKSNPSTETSSDVPFSDRKKAKKEKMKCNICGLVVSSMDSLKIHTFLHTGEYAYCCCVCGEQFSSLSSRQHHMDTHVSAQRFKCNPCGERFTSRAELAKHQLTHEIKCALCGEIFPNKTSRTCHFRVSHPDDILKCSLCSNLFATVEDLEKHLTYHKKGKKEQCPVCGIVVSKLKDHMLMHSQVAQEKLFACDQCPMRYLRKSNLDRHMRTHTGEKPYACNKCTKSFRSNGMLRKHLLTHTKEKPYQCEVCGKQCSLRSNLNIHMRVHNNDRYFPCSLCSQAFNHKNSLHGHMKNKHAQVINMQEMKLNMASNPSHHAPMLAPDIVPEVDKHFSFTERHLHSLDIPVGMPSNVDSDLLKVNNHEDYSRMHSQMNFTVNMPGNMTTSLLMDNDRMILNKYDLQSQTSHTHSY